MLTERLAFGALVFVLAGCGGNPDGKSGGAPPAAAATDPGGTTEAATPLPTLPGATRYTFTLDSFDVAAGAEVYKCQDFPNPFGKDIAILQSQSVMAKGSHHMFAFRLSPSDPSQVDFGPNNTPGQVGDCPAGGLEFHPFFHSSQTPVQDIFYPQGVGRSLKAEDNIRLNVHYINGTAGTLRASMTVTLDYVDASDVDSLAAEVFLNAAGITVPPGDSTQTFASQMPYDINLIGAGSHMHRRGTHFDASTISASDPSNVRLVYETDTWDEPVAAGFDPPMVIAEGDTIQFACSYSNQTGQTLTFGESAATNEMCIFGGTYYPAPNGAPIDAVLFTTAQ